MSKAKRLKWKPYLARSICAESINGPDWLVVDIGEGDWVVARGAHSPTEKYRTKKAAKDRAELLHQIEWIVLCEKWQRKTRPVKTTENAVGT